MSPPTSAARAGRLPAGGPAPMVAVVGRPNVGKSTLVNRLVGRRVAVVEERPGVTRDRNQVDAEWNGRPFTVVDTGGWVPLSGHGGRATGDRALDRRVSAQAETAMAQADLVLLVLDAVVGVTDQDEAVAALLRRSGTPVLVVANKVDSSAREADAWSLARLGLGEPWMLSALHGRGAGDLLDEVVRRLPPEGPGSTAGGPQPGSPASPGRDQAGIPAVAVVGRPNVGKSTLFNRLVGDERAVTHDAAGTTRDAIDTVVETAGGSLRIIDTAGMRRRSRTGEGPEYYSLVRALQAVDRADVSLLVIDATEGVTHQDQRLAERIDAAGSPVVIVLNKWECLDAGARETIVLDVEDRLAFLAYAPIIKISALTGLGVHRLFPVLDQSIRAYHRRVPTRELNVLIQEAQRSHAAPGARVLYATQGATDPPTFTLFSDHRLPAPYLRYLERRIREHFALGPTALKLRARPRAARDPGPRRRG